MSQRCCESLLIVHYPEHGGAVFDEVMNELGICHDP